MSNLGEKVSFCNSLDLSQVDDEQWDWFLAMNPVIMDPKSAPTCGLKFNMALKGRPNSAKSINGKEVYVRVIQLHALSAMM